MLAVVAAPPARTASSSTVITADVPSATSISNQCTAEPARSLGVVQPGSAATTATGAGVCRVDFSSSNDTSTLRIGQADASATAMAGAPVMSEQGTSHADGFAIAAGSANVAYLGGGSGYRRSTDGGDTWSSAGAGDAQWILGASAKDDSILYGVTWGPTFRRSLDGGASWSTVATPFGPGYFHPAAARGTNVIWGANHGEVRRSTDNGTTWSDQSAAVAPSGMVQVSSIDVVSSSEAWILGVDAGNQSVLVRTTNSGTTWPTTPVGLSHDYNSGTISTPSSGVAWAAAANGLVTRTTNGGTTWSASVQAGVGYLADLIAVNSSIAIVSGAYGMARTTDGGATWSLLQAPLNAHVHDFDRFGSGALVAATNGMGVMRSTDNGATWTAEHTVVAQLRATSAVDANTAFAAGSNGTVQRTTDGVSWTDVTSGTLQSMWDIAARSATSALAVGNAGAVHRTTNGTSWNAVSTPVGATVQLRGVDLSASGLALAVGTGGTVARSTDSGASWSLVTSGTSARLHDVSISRSDEQVVWMSGDSLTLRRSTDGGATWSAVGTTGLPGGADLLDVAAVDSQVAWVVPVASSAAYVTTNGGTTWTAWSPSYEARGVDAISADVVAVTSPDGIHVSFDRGTTSTLYSGWFADSLDLLDANTGWGSRSLGGVLALKPGVSISDYTPVSNDWDSPATAAGFGVCVQDVALTAGIELPWVEDTTATPGSCQASTTDPWAAIPTTSTPLATTGSAGGAGRVDLVWGFKAAGNTPPGDYTAGVRFDVVAPGV